MTRSALVTGGAGFIGSHTVAELLRRGWDVTVLDCFHPQVHGAARPRPRDVRLVEADVRDRDRLMAALGGVEVVVHLAAAVGVGQSMYQIGEYVDANVRGTALLLDVLVNERHRVTKLVVASSMSIYGEGAYECTGCGPVHPGLRPARQLEARDWEVRCETCGRALRPIPTAETVAPVPTSVYALTKRDTEELALCVGRAYGLPTIALRFFNVYGPGQALSNPYTGVAAIFCGRLLAGKAPLVFEDGGQSRDFVHVRDVAAAVVAAMESDGTAFPAINIGTGRPLTVRHLAETLAAKLHFSGPLEVLARYRIGDVRHCYAETSTAARILGFTAKVPFEEGVDDLIAWVRTQHAEDHVGRAVDELQSRGLIRG